MKKTLAFILVLMLIFSATIFVFADPNDQIVNPDQNPTTMIKDQTIKEGADKAVGETQQQFAIMGMSGYMLAKTIVNYVALIAALLVFAQYMISSRNANKRGDAISNIGHFLLSLGLYFAINWIFNLVYKFATGL